jgi:hypothetical protein
MRTQSWNRNVLVLSTVLLLLLGCTTPPHEEPVISLTNTNSNLANGGFMAQSNGWRIHAHLIEGEPLGVRLVKSKSTGELVELATDLPRHIQIKDEVIYYTKGMLDSQDPEGYGLFSINMDGSNRQRIGTDQALNLLVLGDRLVYVRYQMTGGQQQYDLVSTTLQGTDLKVLNPGYSSTVLWVANRLILDRYVNEKRQMASMKLDGSDVIVLVTDDFLTFAATDTRIVVAIDTGTFDAEELGIIDLVEINALGTKRTPITTIHGVVPVLADKQWITFVNHNDNHLELYRTRWDGSGKETLLDHDVWGINQLGSDYYCFDEPDPEVANLLIQQAGSLHTLDSLTRAIKKLP